MKKKEIAIKVVIASVVLLIISSLIFTVVINKRSEAEETIVEQNPLINENTIPNTNNDIEDKDEDTNVDETVTDNPIFQYPISNVVKPVNNTKQNTTIVTTPIVTNPTVPVINNPIINIPTVELDKTLPVASINQNGTNGYVHNIDVVITAQDNVGISKIRYAVTNSNNIEPTNFTEVNNSNITISFPVVGDNGEYYIWYYAIDTSGNASQVKVSDVFKIDNILPVANIDNDGTATYVKSASANISASDLSGISKIMYKVVSINNAAEPVTYIEATNVSNVTINFPDVADNNEYYIWYYTVDNTNTESVHLRTTNTFKIDNIAPVLDLVKYPISMTNNVIFNNDGKKHIDVEGVKKTATNEPIDDIKLKVYMEVTNDQGVMLAPRHQLNSIANPIPMFGTLYRSDYTYTSGTRALITLWVEDLAGNKTYIFNNKLKIL